MHLFLSKYINLIDKKGRVSIPANYRNILSSSNSIVIYPSLKNKCIEVWPEYKMQDMINTIDKLELFSKERDAFQTVVFSQSCSLNLDSEGRVIVPKSMLETIQVVDKLMFVGKGNVFEMWNPNLFEIYLDKCKQIAEGNITKLTW
jgi:MraZ protein